MASALRLHGPSDVRVGPMSTFDRDHHIDNGCVTTVDWEELRAMALRAADRMGKARAAHSPFEMTYPTPPKVSTEMATHDEEPAASDDRADAQTETTSAPVERVRLVDLRSLVDCGIPRPWRSERMGHSETWYISGPDWSNGRHCHVATLAGSGMGYPANLIVMAVNDLPELLERVELAEAEVERLTRSRDAVLTALGYEQADAREAVGDFVDRLSVTYRELSSNGVREVMQLAVDEFGVDPKSRKWPELTSPPTERHDHE